MPNKASSPDWFERVPKVELHLHLEGAIPHDALWQLVQKYGGDPTVPSFAALRERFAYKDFPHFLDTWRWKNQFLREYEDFTFIAEAVARDLARQNIRYAELFCSPPDFAQYGLATQPLIEAIHAGLSRVHQIQTALVPDLVRDCGPEWAATTLAEVAEVRHCNIVGIGIGGSEHKYPPEPFAPVYAEARRLGFFTSAHAGEAAGAASVWGAIRTLKVDRIGHGTRAPEDEALLKHLAKHQIPIECNPLSNVRTGVIASIKKHPARLFLRHGILFSVNTDDPQMFGNSLAEEYRQLVAHQHFTRDEIRGVILNGVHSAWLPDERKQELVRTFRADSNWLD